MINFFILSILLILCGKSISSITNTDAEDDRILSLPGIDDSEVPFKQYSGYLSVDNSTGAYIFYWFVESQNDPVNDPLVLWTNGGPGCSGLLGFLTEHGPFRPQKDFALKLNEYSWNKIANMLYIEIPVGVGFSFAEDTKSYDRINDRMTAKHNYIAIQSFFNKFPQFKSNAFYISSESYGGHYIPELALTLVMENEMKNHDSQSLINFRGFLVGNPFTSLIDNFYGVVQSLWGHQVISWPTYKEWKDKCINEKKVKDCIEIEMKMFKEVGNLNIYALDFPVCDSALVSQRLALLKYAIPDHLKSTISLDRKDFEPCNDNYAVQYLNQQNVQKAIHARSTNWSECSDTINYAMVDEILPIEPIYHALINRDLGLKILVYSGDDDTVCATIGTQEWIWRLDYNLTQPWTSWLYDDPVYGQQVGGYLVKWEGINFATVHGAGHEVPLYKPAAALKLFSNYLNGIF